MTGCWKDVEEKKQMLKINFNIPSLVDKENGVSSGRNGEVWGENPV